MSKKNTQQQIASTLKQLKEVPGLFTVLLEHNVTNTKAQTKWTGPPIPPGEWHKATAFFQWTYDTTKSESQVRGYYNTKTRTWAFWAYPQEANLGMAAKELPDHPNFAAQRLQFPASDGWLYFLTAHHHCSASAFQSSGDQRGTGRRDGEENQDGLHITVGNMDKNSYSLHERLYLGATQERRHLIDHDLSWFWDIGDFIEGVPQWARQFLPEDIKDRIARGQMCEKAPEGTTFPQQWKDNVIHTPAPLVTYTPATYQGGLGYNPNGREPFQRRVTNLPYDLNIALEQFYKMCLEHNWDSLGALEEMNHVLKQDPFWVELISLMYRNDVSLEKLAERIEDDIITESDVQETVHEKVKDAINEGMPPYEEGGEWGHLPK